MLSYLLDENISFIVADQALLTELAADSEAHSGVIFVDALSLHSNDFGGVVTALLAHWQRYGSEEWNNRIAFLEPSPDLRHERGD